MFKIIKEIDSPEKIRKGDDRKANDKNKRKSTKCYSDLNEVIENFRMTLAKAVTVILKKVLCFR